MKVRVELITENDIDLNELNYTKEEAEEIARTGWEMIVKLINAMPKENNEKIRVDKVIIEG